MRFSTSVKHRFDRLPKMSGSTVVLTLLLSSVTIVLGWQRPAIASQLELAQQKLSQGRFREVVDDLKVTLAKHPSEPALLVVLGIAEDHLGLYRDANQHMKDALDKLPPCASCWVNLGVNYSHLDQPTEAAHAFLQAIRIDPKLANAYFNLGQVYFDQGKSSDAARVLERARQLAPTDFGIRAELAQSYFKSKNEPALQRLLEEIEVSCGVDPDCQIRLAALLARVGRADAAKQKFENLRASTSGPAYVSYHEALLYYQLGELDRAQQLLEMIPGTAPNQPAIDELKGTIAARRGYFGKAITHFRNAARAQPNERNLFNLAYTLYIDAQFEEAKRTLLYLVRDFPSSFRGYLALGAINQELGKYPESIEVYKKALSLKPSSAIAYVFLGDVEIMASSYASALGSFRRAVALAPGLPEAQYYLGLALAQSGGPVDLNEAVSHFRRAVKEKPSFLMAYLELGKALLKQGQLEQALEALQRALAIGPESPPVHYVLAQCYRRQSQPEKAQYHLKKFEEFKGKAERTESSLQQGLLTSAVAEHQKEE
jgi:protein O-GlcNAc transferase